MRRFALASLSTIVASALFGCTSTVEQTAGTKDQGDQTVDVPTPGTPSFTPPGVEGTAPEPESFPAAHPSMPSIPDNGGKTLSDPVIVTVNFPGFEFASQVADFDAKIGTFDWWSVLSEYGVNAATSGGSYTLADAAPSSIKDSGVRQLILDRINDGTLPMPTDQTIYMLYFPGSTEVSFDPSQGGGSSCSEFDGYHDSFSAPLGPNGSAMQIVYAVNDDCSGSLDDLTDTASHELAEACSDPHPEVYPAYTFFNDNAWTLAGGEVGDMCSMVSGTTEAGYYLTRVWSNKNAKLGNQPCQPLPAMPGELPYFNAGVVKGELSATAGTTVETDLECYSFGALPNEMSIEVQVNSKQILTPTLSKSTCTNGDKVKLSFAVAKAAQKGTSYHYTVTVSEDANNAHIWRGEVNVH